MTEIDAAILLADLALIIVVARAVGRLAKALGQPSVIGEIVAGVLLGPTLLHGAVADTLFPGEVRPYLTALANLGLVLFMFVVGLEFDFGRLRGSGRVAGATVVGSTLVPFGLGLLLAWFLIRDYAPADRTAFVLFIGVAVSVTAFPVLARILDDRGMNGTWLGAMALSTAAICDLAAWTALAGIQALAGVQGQEHWTVLLMVPYALVLITCVRPLLKRVLDRQGPEGLTSPGGFVLVVAGALASAAVTQLFGLHFVIGAFLFGLVMPRPRRADVREALLHRTRYTTGLLLPVYFIVAGLKVDLSRIGSSGLLQLGMIMLVAVTGKFAGTWVAARSQGIPSRGAAVLATLMNTRGLTELIALSIGLEAGLINERLYSLFVLMAVVTTAMTGPLLRWLMGGGTGTRAQLEPEVLVPSAQSGEARWKVR
ncbi:cation:proton antiporter domain-containing protein [Streptomyces sp. NPDC054766]|uniref:cation:proton antiporter domain-containing protein n=1 Tax=Streptomyces rhizosphaerihabitans TaxID=1266770 RepID=UPI0021BFA1BD|nr:cation:proton antiporter [Streptomyces rhizosphaerihabitans]MCT9008484.1 cation:proton antiporter [Streptomyces rhizosphaerihabitans]